MEKEALAIKWALDKLRYYLLGREFTLVSDHAPLKWMAGAKDTNARVTRWFLALQDYRFQVDHRPAGNMPTPTLCPAETHAYGRSETPRGVNQRWMSVATRPQPLGLDGPGERLWRACTAHT